MNHEQSLLGRQNDVKPALKIFDDSGSNRSVKNFIDEVFNFKAVEQQMDQLPQKIETMAGRTRIVEPVPLSSYPAKSFEKKDSGLETPDPGIVITWLFERDGSRN